MPWKTCNIARNPRSCAIQAESPSESRTTVSMRSLTRRPRPWWNRQRQRSSGGPRRALLVAEASVLFLVPAKVVAQKLVPDLAGDGFRCIAGDVVRELAKLRHLSAGECDGNANR